MCDVKCDCKTVMCDVKCDCKTVMCDYICVNKVIYMGHFQIGGEFLSKTLKVISCLIYMIILPKQNFRVNIDMSF